jgi:hypothetical protein
MGWQQVVATACMTYSGTSALLVLHQVRRNRYFGPQCLSC